MSKKHYDLMNVCM